MIAFRGGTVVSAGGSEKRDIYVENGRITQSGEADTEVDVSGCLLFPGFIDSHTHMDMPVSGTVTADSFPTGTAAAVAGGTTVIVDFATQDRGHTLREALDLWHERADGRCACDYGFHMAVTDWNAHTARELQDMIDAGISTFKGYMAYDALKLTDEEILAFLQCTGELGGVVGMHCERGDEVNANIGRLLAEGKTEPRWHPVSRPNSVEADAVSRFLQLARESHGRPWVVHLSTAEGLAAVDEARDRGLPVLTETCPQYLTLTDELYSLPGFEGAKYVCSPPLRSAADRDALCRAAEDGRIDILSTDHCSFNYLGQKELGAGDFSAIPNGLPGVEHRPAVFWSGFVGTGRISKETMCRLMCENPARAMGLWGRKGALLPGFDADIVVWDPSYCGVLRAEDQQMACDYSPWEGMTITGRAKEVWLRGEKAAENGRCIRKSGGKYLKRGIPSI